METIYDPYDIIFGGGQTSPTSDSLLFTNEVMLGDFNTDPPSMGPISSAMDNPENEFNPAAFEAFINELLSTDPSITKEQSIDLPFSSFESEPATREIGTDPMESTPILHPITITTNGINQLNEMPIFIIQTVNKTPTDSSLPTETMPLTTTTSESTGLYNLQFGPTSSSTTNDFQNEDILPLTPSSSSESPDEASSNSPDNSLNNVYSRMLTNFDNLPTTGSLVLTDEEVKLINQEGHQVPKKLPLSKNEERMLKKIRRKIKNKISAQESRRKKKEYVDTLEKKIKNYATENKALKERVAEIEKNHKKLTQERDLLRSMINKGTPASRTVLMVFVVFFAILFSIWSPFANKSIIEDRLFLLENSFVSPDNYQSTFTSQKSLAEQQEASHTSYATNNYKSRVLLSVDEYNHQHHHHHSPYLPSKTKYQSTSQQKPAALGYAYSDTIEKYMNKRIRPELLTKETNNDHRNNLKRQFIDESSSNDRSKESTNKKVQTHHFTNGKNFRIEETNDEIIDILNESKPVKIIRVERTGPAARNDTLKLAHRSVDK